MERLAVHHIGIVVDDLDEAVRFMTGVLGLEVREWIDVPGGRGAFLPCGAVELELLQYLDPKRQANVLGGVDARIEHIAFHVDDADAAYAALIEHGVRAKAPPKDWKGRKSFFTTPETSDGVTYQFREPTGHA